MANDDIDCGQLSFQEKCLIYGTALQLKKHQMPRASNEKQAMNKEDEKNIKQRGVPMQSLHSCSENNLIACLERKLENAEVEKANLKHSLEDLEMQKAKLESENENLLHQVDKLRHQLLPLPPPPPPPPPPMPMPMPQALSSLKLKTRSVLQTVSRAVKASPKTSTYGNALKEMKDRLKSGQSILKTIPLRQVPATAKSECEGILQLKAMLGSLRSHHSLKGSQSPCETRSSTTIGSKRQCLLRRRQSCPYKLKPENF